MKKYKVLLAVLVVLSLVLTACAKPTATPVPPTVAPTEVPAEPTAVAEEPTAEAAAEVAPAAGESKGEIGVVFTSLNNPVFAFMKEKMEARIIELGYTPVILDSQENAETELQNVENLISKGVKGICILPVNADAAINSVKKANEAGIPIVGWNRVIDTKGEATFASQVVTDNVPGAVEAGKLAVELLKDVEDPKVVILRGLSGIDADADRSSGFRDGIKGTALENAVVSEKAADFERQKGYTVMADIIQAQPKIDLVYALNDEMAIGAFQALKEAGMTDVKIIGYDGAEGCVEMIAKGEITATVAQQFATLGTKAVESVIAAAEDPNVELEPVVKIGTEMVTIDNAKGYVFK